MTPMRAFDAVCYVIAGIALLFVSTRPGMGSFWAVAIGLAWLRYLSSQMRH